MNPDLDRKLVFCNWKVFIDNKRESALLLMTKRRGLLLQSVSLRGMSARR
jgi:hypothetical protein